MFDDPLRSWDGEEVVIRFDPPSAAWMFVGVHSTVLGPAMGGTRMKSYASPDDALRDVLRLSAAMTMKQAAAGLPYGGGKAVLAVADVPAAGSPERRALLLRYATLVESLHGSYVTAADMNTDAADMDTIGERTIHVLGRSKGNNGGSGDPGADTALGVFHGIVAACRHVFDTAELHGRTVLIQGAGAVGAQLARHLHDAGATLLVADVDAARAATIADALDAQVVDPDAVIGIPCDVYAPCATGAVLTRTTISRLRCRAVAGAANNQLGEPSDAGLLRERGILYAPDYVINAGGVLHLAGSETLGWDDAALAARLAGIGVTLEEIFREADRDGVTTLEVADRIAQARIAAARPS